jgi:flavin-dependent dehydrogenase
MKTIQIPYEPDVIAISDGTAGSSAAVAAARRGLKVLVLEEGNCFGGLTFICAPAKSTRVALRVGLRLDGLPNLPTH